MILMDASTQVIDPKPRRWSRDEYYKMADLGWFHDQRVELIDGAIVVLSPQKFLHYSTTDRVGEVLRRAFGAGFWVRVQAPMNFDPYSEPEPDVSVVAGTREDYADHPTTALLLVEISDSSLLYDRHSKASLYARVGIADYWIVNLVDGRLEVHRNPAVDSTQPYGFAYADVTALTRSDELSPLAAPHVRIPVADLLP